MHTRPGMGAQQPARRPSMPTEGGAAAHAGLVVLGLPLACMLLDRLHGVREGSPEWGALRRSAQVHAWSIQVAGGCRSWRHRQQGRLPGCILLAGAPPSCTLLLELHRVCKGSPELAALLCGARTRLHGASSWRGLPAAGAAAGGAAAHACTVLPGPLLAQCLLWAVHGTCSVSLKWPALRYGERTRAHGDPAGGVAAR